MSVITVNGQIGSGVLDLAARVSRRLGFDYVDRLVLAEAGRRVGVSIEALVEKEQQIWTIGARLGRLFHRASETSAYGGFGGDSLYGLGMDALHMRP